MSKSPKNEGTSRLAIRCIRPDLTDDRDRDEHEMMELGVRLGYAVDETAIRIDPTKEGPYATVMLALGRTRADAVIVPDLEHVDGIDGAIRERVLLITLEGERVLTRTAPISAVSA